MKIRTAGRFIYLTLWKIFLKVRIFDEFAVSPPNIYTVGLSILGYHSSSIIDEILFHTSAGNSIINTFYRFYYYFHFEGSLFYGQFFSVNLCDFYI